MQGADSTQPIIVWAVLFLAHNQDIKRRGFNEVRKSGAYVGGGIETGDVEYIQTFIKELVRFYTVLPLAMP